MPANTPFNVVDGPRFTPLPYGLLSAAEIVNDPNPHWQVGTMFRADTCESAHAVSAFCVAGGPATGTPTKTPTASGAPSSAAEPFTVYAVVPCATVGWGDDLAEYRKYVETALDNGEGRAVETVAWTGVPDQGPTVFPHLAHNAQVFTDPMGTQYRAELQSDATVVNGTATEPKKALAQLEGALAECYGGVGVIHMARRVASLLLADAVLEARGGVLYTKLGNKVAAYSYGGGISKAQAAPAAGESWMYGTGAVMIRRSPLKNPGQRPAEFVGKNDNSMFYVAERTFVWDWDCCHLAILSGSL